MRGREGVSWGRLVGLGASGVLIASADRDSTVTSADCAGDLAFRVHPDAAGGVVLVRHLNWFAAAGRPPPFREFLILNRCPPPSSS